MADPDKVKVMRWMIPPTCVREVRHFIGMCRYYSGFIPEFWAIARHLIRLPKKFVKLEWNKECQAAIDFLKENLTPVPALAYWDTSKPYILHTDAGDDYNGVCLCQE